MSYTSATIISHGQDSHGHGACQAAHKNIQTQVIVYKEHETHYCTATLIC